MKPDTGLVMIIDGSNLLMRCIKAMEYSGLRSGESWHTGPLTAFIGALGRFTRVHAPASLVVCWDHGPSVYRSSLYPEYKSARRQDSPAEAERKETAFGMTKHFLRLARVPQVAAPGYEADDVVAAYWAACPDRDKIIVSGDKDFLQLVDERTRQLRPEGAGGYRLWGPEEVEDKYGCPPERLALLMALLGDPSDGVPGVHGLGPKKALKGLQEASWELEKVPALADLDKLALARMSHMLVDLRSPGCHPAVPDPVPFAPLDPSEGGACLDFITFLRSMDMEGVLSSFYTRNLWN